MLAQPDRDVQRLPDVDPFGISEDVDRRPIPETPVELQAARRDPSGGEMEGPDL